MKRFIIIILAFSCMMIFNGCSEKTPKETVINWATAVAEGNLDTADKLSTSNVHLYNKLLIAGIKDKSYDTPDKMGEILEKIEPAREEINGDTAKVYIDEKNPIQLKKVDGKWKVDFAD